MSNFSTQYEESCSKNNGSKLRFALGDLIRTIPNCSGIFLSLTKRLGTANNQNKAFFYLHNSVEDSFELKEILCFHSLSCIGIQIALMFKLKVSFACLFNCRTIFPTFLFMIFYFPDSKYWNSFQGLSPFYFSFIKINRNTFFKLLRRYCNISFSETSVAMLDLCYH